MKIRRLAEGLNVAPMLWALRANPQLWNRHDQRTAGDSPHSDVDDIWCRYGAPGGGAPGPHESVWYPAADLLPVRQMVYPLMTHFRGERLGGVLITQIPAGKSCKPHKDDGWHARHYEKLAIQIESAPGQRFCFEGESLETKPGDLFTFDNSHTHWVDNPGPHNRITLIVCIRLDGGGTCLGQQ